jgi:hypothetical protein
LSFSRGESQVDLAADYCSDVIADMEVTLPHDADKTIAASEAETGVPTRVLLKDQTPRSDAESAGKHPAVMNGSPIGPGR